MCGTTSASCGRAFGDLRVILSAVAASTTRLKLGLAVTPLARRRPQVVANAVAILDLLSDGRMIFGAGPVPLGVARVGTSVGIDFLAPGYRRGIAALIY